MRTNPSPEGVLHVSQLTKHFGRLTALDRVSFSVRPGEILGLIGPNGAGKTTLFECLTGMMPMDRGTVTLGGRELKSSERQQHLFYAPDGIAPWPNQTVRWALDFAVGFFGGPAARRADIIQQLDLQDILDSPLGTLSKGQRKRAVLAIGLLTPQPILLIDEPFDGLDLRQSRDLGATLRAHATGGRTLFLSIHQISDAARVCDRFVLLSAGRIRGEGTLDELAANAAAAAPASKAGTDLTDLEEVFLALT